MAENLLTSPLLGAGTQDLTVDGKPNLKLKAHARGTGTITIYQADGEQTKVYTAEVDSADFEQVETGDAVVVGRNLFSDQNYSHHSNAGYNQTAWTSAVVEIMPPNVYTLSYVVADTNRFGVWQDPLEDGLYAQTTNDFILTQYRPTLVGEEITETVTTWPSEGNYLVIYLANTGNDKKERFKAELGSAPTVWTPAHEDIAGNVRVEITGDVELEDAELFVPRVTSGGIGWLMEGYPVGITIAGESLNGTPIQITEDDILAGSFLLDREICSSNKLSLGGGVASELSVTLLNDTGKFDGVRFEGAELTVDITANGEIIRAGLFTIDERPTFGYTIQLRALDRLARSNRDYDTTLSLPASAQAVLNDACAKCNIPNRATAIPNGNFTVPTRPEDCTYHDIIRWVAQIAGGFAYVDKDGYLDIKTMSDTAYFELGESDIFSVTLAESNITVSGFEYTPEDDELPIVLAGTRDYTIDLTENLLIGQSPDILLASLQASVSNFTFRPLKGLKTLFLPFLWPGDRIRITVDEVTIETVITSAQYNGDTMEFSASGEPEIVKGYATGAPFSPSQKRALSRASAQVFSTRITPYQQAMLQLNSAMNNSLGFYPTIVTQPDGSMITYSHDKPTLEESSVIYMQSVNGFAWTETGWNNGSPVWDNGVTKDGSMVMRLISTVGLNAEWITTGQLDASKIVVRGNLLDDKIADLEDADHVLNQQLMDYKAGGSNLVLNSDFGNVQSPSAEWWTEQDATTCALVLARFDTCDKLTNSGLTCAQLLTYNW